MPTSMPPPEAESSLASGSQVFRATLDSCDSEPIHIPGLIQPSGALVAFDPALGSVLHASANLGRWLWLGNLPVVGLSLSDLLGEPAYERVAHALTGRAGSPVRHEVVDLPARPDAGQPHALEAMVHTHRGVCLIEIEPVAAALDHADWLQRLNDAVDVLRSADGLEELCQRMAHRVKRLAGFDRVMVYRFDEDHHGHVVADAHEHEMESFYDLHYPASDIPAQARALYVSNLVRYIADVGYTPVPVLPWLDTGQLQRLDMSHAMLRSVSPMHIQYLQNMGVASTLTLSLLVDGRLWGLIACHHRQPTALPLRLRRACYALSVTAGYMTGWLTSQQRIATSAAAAKAQVKVWEAFNQPQVPLRDVVEQCTTPLLQMVGASGGALWRGGTVLAFGQWPGEPRGESVLRFVRHAFENSVADHIATEQADLQPPLEVGELREVCGVMAIKFDGLPSSGLVWLRPEQRSEVTWGGDPDKPVDVKLDAEGRSVLAPRSSFALWTTIIKGQSRPWTDADREAAASLATVSQVLLMRDSLAQISLSDRQFHSLVSLQSDAYWQTDRKGRVVKMSKPLPLEHRMLQGMMLADVFAESGDCDGLTQLREALAGDRPFRALRVSVRMRAETAALTFLLSGESLRDIHGQAIGWHGTLTDITREAQFEAAKQQEVVAAELANQAKSTFLANMSHEIRTPLNAILGFTQLLSRDTQATPIQSDQIGKIAAAGQHLLAIVNDILDLSKIEAGQVQLESSDFQLAAVFDHVISVLGSAAHDKGLGLEVDIMQAPPWLRGDATRLRQALLNFAGNAVKFTHQGSVTLRARLLEEVDGELLLHFSVQDSGIGIAAETLQRLFQDFEQADSSTSRQYGGTGLGLAITRRLARLMGGEAGADSTPGVGSTFWFTARMQRGVGAEPDAADVSIAPAPVAATATARATDVQTQLRERHGHARILLVEDNEINRELALSWLNDVGLSADMANNGREAVQRAQAVAYDLILMDMQMPVMGGLEATRAIRALPQTAAMPIVAMTANVYTEERSQCLAAGMNDVVIKPVDVSALYATLLKWLEPASD
jgi:light-regulated signal transduction histidine kinase (bacteriophytochrome)/ActR/RegA family two-component response regulator